MTPQAAFFLRAGAVLALTGVLFGAVGTHVLRARISLELIAVYGTAVQYQMYHALALLAVGLIGNWLRPTALLGCAGWFMLVGVVLFSGSLYLLALTEIRQWGVVTPIGGGALLLGWLALLIALRAANWRERR